jgi:hypothetical protein
MYLIGHIRRINYQELRKINFAVHKDIILFNIGY